MRKTITFFVAFLLVFSCKPANHSGEPANDTCSPTHIKELAQTDYEGAMKLADEALRKGEISLFTAHTLRANITYQFTEDYDAAAAYMQKALELDEAQDLGTRSELLYHLATILRNSRDFTALLATCTEGKDCAHKAGKAFEEYSFDFLAGNCFYDLGEEETGFEMMHTALSAAEGIASTEPDYGHLLFFFGQYINILLEDKNYQDALPACTTYESLIGRMESAFPGVDPAYIDRCLFYLDIKRAICKSYLGDPSASAQAFKSAQARRYAATTGGKTFLVGYYAASGQPGKILDIYQNDLPFTDADTVCRSYRIRLARLKEAYTNAGIPEKVREYQDRYDALSRGIEAKEQAEGTLVGAAKYDTQRYRLKLEDTTEVLRSNQRLILVLFLVFVVTMSVLLLLTSKKARQHRKENQTLEKSLSSIQRQVTIIAERDFHKSSAGKGETETSLRELIEGQELYLNKNLNRQGVTDLLGRSSHEIDKMLEEIAPGLSFPDYIKSLRIRHALKLMGEKPDIPVAELADRCGFYTIRTFQRAFLAVVGKTPSDYIKELKTNK